MKLKLASLAMLLVSAVTLAAAPARMATLPSDWFQLPEDGKASGPTSETYGPQSWGLLNRTLDEILAADALALQKFENYSHAATFAKGDPTDLTKWHLGCLQFDLGISATGILAPIALKGSANIAVLFRKKEAPTPTPAPKPAYSDSEDSTPIALNVDANTRPGDVKAQLEPIIQMAIATKKVNDELELRKNLYVEADRFYTLSSALDRDFGNQWYASRLRLDVTISVSGKVHPNVNVGGEFKVRFEWHRIMKPGVRRVAWDASDEDKAEVNPLREKFIRFVKTLADDFDVQDYRRMYDRGFFPNYVRLGFGITATGNFAVVKFGGGIAGYLYFSCGAKAPSYGPTERPASNEPLLLIENHPSPQHLAYAKANGISYETEGKYGIIDNAIFKLNHMAFRRGLKRSAKMSTWFADRASRAHIGKWRIHELRPYFELSIGANLKLVSINGFGGVEFSFYNGNF